MDKVSYLSCIHARAYIYRAFRHLQEFLAIMPSYTMHIRAPPCWARAIYRANAARAIMPSCTMHEIRAPPCWHLSIYRKAGERARVRIGKRRTRHMEPSSTRVPLERGGCGSRGGAQSGREREGSQPKSRWECVNAGQSRQERESARDGWPSPPERGRGRVRRTERGRRGGDAPSEEEEVATHRARKKRWQHRARKRYRARKKGWRCTERGRRCSASKRCPDHGTGEEARATHRARKRYRARKKRWRCTERGRRCSDAPSEEEEVAMHRARKKM